MPNRNVDASIGQALDFGNYIDILMVQDHVSPHRLSHFQTMVISINPDDERCSHKPGARGGAQANWTLPKDDHCIADTHIT